MCGVRGSVGDGHVGKGLSMVYMYKLLRGDFRLRFADCDWDCALRYIYAALSEE